VEVAFEDAEPTGGAKSGDQTALEPSDGDRSVGDEGQGEIGVALVEVLEKPNPLPTNVGND